MNREILISYAYAFLSRLFSDPMIKGRKIKAVYLFGSVARGDFDSESDIDLFIDTEEDIKGLVEKILQKFTGSEEYKKFGLMGIQNELKVLHGELEKWDLKKSIETDGVALYSSSTKSMKSFYLISFEPIKDVGKRNKVTRKLFGRKEKNYNGGGLVEKLGGNMVNQRAFLIPAENLNFALKIFSKENAKYKLTKIWV